MKRLLLTLLILAGVGAVLLALALHVRLPIGIDGVLKNSWIPDACTIHDRCTGDMEFTSDACLLKDDGYVYHHDQPVARFLEASMPLISESAPWTGGKVRFLKLDTREECTYLSTSHRR